MTRTLETVGSLLAIDVGNTRVGLAAWTPDGMRAARRISAADDADWSEALRAAWSETDARAPRAVVIASVAPRVSEAIAELAEVICDVAPLNVRDDFDLPMPLDIENPRDVGVDRVCSAAAAFERYRTACCVASFGTAITVDCVDRAGRFLGGAILPGIQMSLDALHEGTAGLPAVEIDAPPSAFGRNTVEAMLAGAVYGAVGALRDIVERYATHLGVWPTLVATGGNAALLAEYADYIDDVTPDLCLSGVALAYRKAAGQS